MSSRNIRIRDVYGLKAPVPRNLQGQVRPKTRTAQCRTEAWRTGTSVGSIPRCGTPEAPETTSGRTENLKHSPVKHWYSYRNSSMMYTTVCTIFKYYTTMQPSSFGKSSILQNTISSPDSHILLVTR